VQSRFQSRSSLAISFRAIAPEERTASKRHGFAPGALAQGTVCEEVVEVDLVHRITPLKTQQGCVQKVLVN